MCLVVELGPVNATIHKTNECVAAADLNGDGAIDLVASSFGTAQVAGTLNLYIQTAPGVFNASPTVLQPGSFPRSVAAADFDGDGDLDLISPNATNGLTLFIQDAPGTFTKSATPLSTFKGAIWAEPADLDGDGDMDLVAATPENSSLAIFFQTTPGIFFADPNGLETGGKGARFVTS